MNTEHYQLPSPIVKVFSMSAEIENFIETQRQSINDPLLPIWLMHQRVQIKIQRFFIVALTCVSVIELCIIALLMGL